MQFAVENHFCILPGDSEFVRSLYLLSMSQSFRLFKMKGDLFRSQFHKTEMSTFHWYESDFEKNNNNYMKSRIFPFLLYFSLRRRIFNFLSSIQLLSDSCPTRRRSRIRRWRRHGNWKCEMVQVKNLIGTHFLIYDVRKFAFGDSFEWN